MASIRIYDEDLEIAKSILRRDEKVTREFFYKKCYPLFKSIYDHYHTDCESCFEFINEIYILVLTPSLKTGKCQLENYRGDSTLTNWLKTVCIFYCYARYKKKQQMDIQNLPSLTDNYLKDADKFSILIHSIGIDDSYITRSDYARLVAEIKNERYRELIWLYYIEDYSNEETAARLGMSMSNYYNKKILAKEQFRSILKNEYKNE